MGREGVEVDVKMGAGTRGEIYLACVCAAFLFHEYALLDDSSLN